MTTLNDINPVTTYFRNMKQQANTNYLIGSGFDWEVLDDALTTWGREEQEAMAIGEIGEYLTLEGRAAQGRCTDEDKISEIADVIIMMHQMAAIYGKDNVKDQINYKLIRLKDRLIKFKESSDCALSGSELNAPAGYPLEPWTDIEKQNLKNVLFSIDNQNEIDD